MRWAYKPNILEERERERERWRRRRERKCVYVGEREREKICQRKDRLVSLRQLVAFQILNSVEFSVLSTILKQNLDCETKNIPNKVLNCKQRVLTDTKRTCIQSFSFVDNHCSDELLWTQRLLEAVACFLFLFLTLISYSELIFSNYLRWLKQPM